MGAPGQDGRLGAQQFQQLADDRKMPASPLLGRMSKAQWERLHLVHAAHHFRWLAEK